VGPPRVQRLERSWERTTRFTLLCCTCPACRAMENSHDQETPPTDRTWCRGGSRCDRCNDRNTAFLLSLRRSLTWTREAEMAQHANFRIDHRPEDLLLDPHSPLGQRGSNENTNGAAGAEYFPKRY